MAAVKPLCVGFAIAAAAVWHVISAEAPSPVEGACEEVPAELYAPVFLDTLDGGVWRTVGVENDASGKFEFTQTWLQETSSWNSSADASWYKYSVCSSVNGYNSHVTGNYMAMLDCTEDNQHTNSQACLVDILEGFHTVDVAFVACNHSGFPAPKSFEAAMNTPKSEGMVGNFFMVRCKAGVEGCNFRAIETGKPVPDPVTRPAKMYKPAYIADPRGMPPALKGQWRAMQISQNYPTGIAQWKFTGWNNATLSWPNYPNREVEHFELYSSSESEVVLRNTVTGIPRRCLFDSIPNDIVTYSLLTCGPEGGDSPASSLDGMNDPDSLQFAMARCNRGSKFCRWSFGSANGIDPKVKWPGSGLPCATTGPAFRPEPKQEARMACTVGEAGEFTDYQLETQFTSCTPDIRTLHGLWADYDGANHGGYSWPQYCRDDVPFDIKAIEGVPGLRKKMEKLWPSCPPGGIGDATQDEANMKFWTHEWDRHGSCAPVNYGIGGYFATAIGILEQYPFSSGRAETSIRLNRSYVDSIHTQICGQDNSRCGGFNPPQIVSQHDWCQRDQSCWPSPSDVAELRSKLNPEQPRNLNWQGQGIGQPSAVPQFSEYDQSLYGLGNNLTEIDALYVNGHPGLACYTQPNQLENNNADEWCKASTRNQPYNGWEPDFVVFALTEDHLQVALQFAVDHNLCIMVAGTGHEYLNRHSCPSGGFMIRTTAMQQVEFFEKWTKDPSASPHGAFTVGPGVTFSLAHQVAAQHDRVISSGWCTTVGLMGWSLGGGHGPLAPSLGLGADNTVQFTVLQVDEFGTVVKRTVNAQENKDLLWAMKGGGGSAWGLISSLTIKAHRIPSGGITRYYVQSDGNFCPDSEQGGYHSWDFLQTMLPKYAAWQLTLSSKFAIQASIWPTVATPGDGCSGSWSLNVEYFYAGPRSAKEAQDRYQALKKLLQPNKNDASTDTVTSFKNYFEYVASFKGDKFALRPAPAAPTSNMVTGAQSSALISREVLRESWAPAILKILKQCPDSGRCPFHYMYLGLTGNVGSPQPQDTTALSPGMRSYPLLHNARQLSELEMNTTLYSLSDYSYFSESAYYMHDWGHRYWGDNFEKLKLIKQKYDPRNVFWCHHCVGDEESNPN